MSNRIKGFHVALTQDVHEYDFEQIKAAVLMVRGVESVTASISDSGDWMNRQQIRREMLEKIRKIAAE